MPVPFAEATIRFHTRNEAAVTTDQQIEELSEKIDIILDAVKSLVTQLVEDLKHPAKIEVEVDDGLGL